MTVTGALDTSFNANLTGDSAVIVDSIAQAADGSYYIGGTFTGFTTAQIPYFAHLSSTGLVDTNFITNLTGTSASVSTIAVQADGNIIIG